MQEFDGGGTTGKDRLAAAVEEAWLAFDRQLRQKGAYPVDLFNAFFKKATLYAEATKVDALIHRAVAAHVSGLREHLELERKRVPGQVLADADRLECVLFSGYDPHFEGDKPPRL
jgi:hypothetical protein